MFLPYNDSHFSAYFRTIAILTHSFSIQTVLHSAGTSEVLHFLYFIILLARAQYISPRNTQIKPFANTLTPDRFILPNLLQSKIAKTHHHGLRFTLQNRNTWWCILTSENNSSYLAPHLFTFICYCPDDQIIIAFSSVAETTIPQLPIG